MVTADCRAMSKSMRPTSAASPAATGDAPRPRPTNRQSRELLKSNPYSSPLFQRWSTFLRLHAQGIIPCDFLIAVTATFRQLYVFVVIEHRSRRLIHCNITAHPSATWTLQQLREAIGFQDRYEYLLHDRGSIIAKHLFTVDSEIVDPPSQKRAPTYGLGPRCPGSAYGNASQLQFRIPTSPARGCCRARERRAGWSPP